MIDKYAKTKISLWELSREVYDYAYEHYSLPHEWSGNDIVVTSFHATDAAPVNQQLAVVTSAAREVAWLFDRLRDAFGSVIDDSCKQEFYARLARSINMHEMTVDREHKTNSLLRTGLDEAFVMLDEMQKGTFETLVDRQNMNLVIEQLKNDKALALSYLFTDE